MRTCSKCQEIKQESEFYRRKNSYRSHCIICVKIGAGKRAEIKSSYDKIYYQSNKSKIDARAIKYAQEHKDAKRKYDKRKLKEVLEKRRIRYRNDIGYKLKCNLRSRLNVALKRSVKTAHTLELLGCSIEELKQYIASKFTSNMDWQSVMCGKIHIDHIKPCASFDLSQPEQQTACFHYSNLQPLWAADNNKKRDKLL